MSVSITPQTMSVRSADTIEHEFRKVRYRPTRSNTRKISISLGARSNLGRIIHFRLSVRGISGTGQGCFLDSPITCPRSSVNGFSQ